LGVSVKDDVSVTSDPLAVFGRLPRGTLFETRWGLVDADPAAFFKEEGEPVRPYDGVG
jgi:hypothetical protein